MREYTVRLTVRTNDHENEAERGALKAAGG